MTLYKCIITALLIAPSANAYVLPSTYHGQPINKDTLLSLVPAVSKELECITQLHFIQNPTLADVLSGWSYSRLMPGSDHAPFCIHFAKLTKEDRSFFESLRASLAQAGIHAAAGAQGEHRMRQNFNIDLGQEWIIKASGLLNRRANILHEMGLNNLDPELPQEKLNAFMECRGGHTYQTISRMAYWLRAKEAKETLQLDRVCVPEEYLVHIPGRPLTLDDTNYVVVSRRIPGAVRITETDLLGDEELVAQLAQAILYSSLWDINGSNVLAVDGKACLIDFEQPNAFKPSEFGRGGIMSDGITKLNNMIQAYGERTGKDVSHLKELTTTLLKSVQ